METAERVAVGILAGGQSRRMGRDKALLTFDGRTALAIIAEEMRDFPETLVSAAEPGRLGSLGLPVCRDEHKGIGPIEGIRRLLETAKAEYVFVCAVDMAFISREAVRALARRICPEYDCYVITRGGVPEPMCAIYSRRALPVIERLISQGRYRPREIFRECPTLSIPLESSGLDAEILMNINTPEDYAKALQAYRARQEALTTSQGSTM